MTERDAATIKTVLEFLGHTRECAVHMMMNAMYIQGELSNVRMSDELRERTENLCSVLIGTKHDLVSEIFELDERLGSGAGNEEVLRRVNRMVQWAGEDTLKMHEVVMALEAELEGGGAIVQCRSSADWNAAAVTIGQRSCPCRASRSRSPVTR